MLVGLTPIAIATAIEFAVPLLAHRDKPDFESKVAAAESHDYQVDSIGRRIHLWGGLPAVFLLAAFVFVPGGAIAKGRADAGNKVIWTVVTHPEIREGVWVLLASDAERIFVARAAGGELVGASIVSLPRSPPTGRVAYERRELGRLRAPRPR